MTPLGAGYRRHSAELGVWRYARREGRMVAVYDGTTYYRCGRVSTTPGAGSAAPARDVRALVRLPARRLQRYGTPTDGVDSCESFVLQRSERDGVRVRRAIFIERRGLESLCGTRGRGRDHGRLTKPVAAPARPRPCRASSLRRQLDLLLLLGQALPPDLLAAKLVNASGAPVLGGTVTALVRRRRTGRSV